MEITDVRVKLANNEKDNLLAYCSVIFDDSFVVTDLKVVNGNNGVFVSMPSRKVMNKCPSCKAKNHIRARFCNDCGKKLDFRCVNDSDRRLYVDTAHPIKPECRQMIVEAVMAAYADECSRESSDIIELDTGCNITDCDGCSNNVKRMDDSGIFEM